MANRFNITSTSRFDVPGLKSGYESGQEGTLTIPSVGIEDVDRALFNFLDKESKFVTKVPSSGIVTTVPVIFAAGEKWALQKRSMPMRDRNNTLILPLITVVRTTIEQSPVSDITGRGINQQAGELYIKRSLSTDDRSYQNIINRLGIKNQRNVAIDNSAVVNDELSTSRRTGDLTSDPTTQDGGFLLGDKKNNIIETLAVPSPQFYTATYEVTFWAQFNWQMSQLLEQTVASYLPQGNAWKLETNKGYWFIATVDANVFNSDSNADDMSQEERIIKYKFTVKVQAYVLASNVPGAPIALKRYVSAPVITFDISTNADELTQKGGIDEPFLGSDDPTLPLSDSTRRRDGRETTGTRLYPNIDDVNPQDPALRSVPRGQSLARFKKVTTVDRNGKTVTKLVRISSVNTRTGETTFSSGFDLGGTDIIVSDS
jgi:hypothetical protein